MFFFDVVFEVNIYELINVVDQVNCELFICFDFKGVDVKFVFEDSVISQLVFSDFQFQQMIDILCVCLIVCSIDICCLEFGDIEINLVGVCQKIIVKQGIEQKVVKQIVVKFKEVKFKVDSQINGDKLCVNGKKCDDLQDVIVLLKKEIFEVLLQFDNFCD